MVRELKKPEKGLKELEKMEKEVNADIDKIEKIRQKDFKDNELNTSFFFSVVFNTNEEKDDWLKKHNIQLIEDRFVMAKDFNV